LSARIQRLRAELSADLRASERQLAKLGAIDLASDPNEGDLARAAVALHHGYCAIESAFVRLVRELGEGEPAGPDWHQIILDDMGLEIPDVRPPLLQQSTIDSLRQLLAFRHFFRHAYAVELDAERLADLQRIAIIVGPALRDDFERFDAFLAALAAPPA
jgi:hypothetical protein